MPADTALHKACNAGDLSLVQKLVEEPEDPEEPNDVNAPGAGDRRPIHRAAGANHVDVVTFLIEKGALVDQPDKSGRTAMHWAAISGHTQVAKALVAAGGSIFTATASGMTPLHAACEGGRAEFVEYLLKTAAEQDAAATSEQIAAGAEAGVSKICNAKDADGKLPFDLAMAGKHKAVVTHLKGAGDPNAQSASCVIS